MNVGRAEGDGADAPDAREWFYDCLFYDCTDDEGRGPVSVQVTRVYCLDWHHFTDAHWDALMLVYRSLPGWLEEPAQGCPMWFGADEDAAPWLLASVEPSGLAAGGRLPLTDWRAWDAGFRLKASAAGLPVYRV